MKKISKTVVVFIVGVLVAFTIDVAAEAVISSGAVSYSNAATSETTVSGALDELFSAVDINNKIGTTDISAIGDGTITGAIDTINSSLFLSSGFSDKVSYTTAVWSPGKGGFSWTCPTSGFYYLKTTFLSGSGSMADYQFQLKKSSSSGITEVAYGFGLEWLGAMPMQEISTIVYLNAGEIIYPYIHTATADVVINTRLYYVLLKKA